MKKGLTLAEILITLAIIGVIAAIGAPAINKLMPNKNEEMFFKAYDTLRETVRDLASNSRIYPACFATNLFGNPINIVTDKYPLYNTAQPVEDQYRRANLWQGNRKLCDFVGTAFGINSNNLNCEDDIPNYNNDDVLELFNDNDISFSTQNGMKWFIFNHLPPILQGNGPYTLQFAIEAWVDVDSSNNNVNNIDLSCTFDANNCTNPDIFKFWITADGEVNPGDAKGLEYINKRAKNNNIRGFDLEDVNSNPQDLIECN